jgi:hypothetical protein
MTLRANAAFLGVAAIAAFLFDILGVFFGIGPQSRALINAPHAGIGFIEAHGLALILSVILWRAAPVRFWNLAALAIDVLLGSANLVFWDGFIAADMLPVGYVTTTLHWTFAVLQFCAAMRRPEERSAEGDPAIERRAVSKRAVV